MKMRYYNTSATVNAWDVDNWTPDDAERLDVYDDANARTTGLYTGDDADEMDALRDIFNGTHRKGGAY